MAPQAIIILLIIICIPIGWLASEFSKHRSLRIALGLGAMASSMGVASLVGMLSQLNYNAWYGSASKDLIDTTITQIEDGNIDRVMSVLRRLNLDYHPTYENRANYDELVKEAVSLMKGDFELQGTKWDTGPFTRETWLGHWQDDSNYWIVITQLADAGIVQSGEDFPKIRDFVVSADFKKITFAGGDQWLHELRLVNKYEALHVWRHLNDGKVWKENSLHKLIRATSAQRQFTQQSNP